MADLNEKQLAEQKLAHTDEFTAIEAGDEAGAVGFWFRAVQLGNAPLAVFVWNTIIRAEHYLSALDHDPAKRTPDELGILDSLKAAADAAKQQVRDAEAASHRRPGEVVTSVDFSQRGGQER